METIKGDLAQIRYYYVHKEQFDSAFNSIGRGAILDKVEKYNQAICQADPRIFEMYDYLTIIERPARAAEIASVAGASSCFVSVLSLEMKENLSVTVDVSPSS